MNEDRAIRKLAEEFNISYEDARYALENSNYNIHEAVIFLEKRGKINKNSKKDFKTSGGFSETKKDNKNNCNKEDTYSTKGTYNTEYTYKKSDDNSYNQSYDKDYSNDNSDNCGVFGYISRFINTTNNISFNVIRNGRRIIKVPLTVILLLLCFAFYIVVPISILGLFFDFSYYLDGKKSFPGVNRFLSSLSNLANSIKKIF